MEIQAKSKYIRTAPRKLRLVASAVRDVKPEQALVLLEHLGKRASGPLMTTLKSVLANAQKTHGLDSKTLKIKKIEIAGGPIYKRFQAVSRGQAHGIKKRTSHITIVLEGEREKE